MRPFLLLALWLSCHLLSAQNLIRNPSFEEIHACPKRLGELHQAKGWSSANKGTPDLYHACYDRPQVGPGIGMHGYGNIHPMHGSAFAGIRHDEATNECLQGELLQPLTTGTTYVLRLRLSRRPHSNAPLPVIEVAFSKGPRADADPMAADPALRWQRAVRGDSNLANAWEIWHLSYEAQGGEDHILLSQSPNARRWDAYTVIDFLELYPCAPGRDCAADHYTGPDDPDPDNLIPNGGFEQRYQCPDQREDLAHARAWRVAAYTPDFYHVCGTGTASAPDNEMGAQWPHGGEGYGGFWAYVIPGLDYREFLSIRLKEPLQPGRRYQLTLWLSLAEASNVALCGLTVRASAAPPDNPRVAARPGEFVVAMEAEGVLQERDGWQPLRATFTAQGGERFLTIGNYRQEADDCLIEIGGNTRTYKAAQKAAYYYVDDVRLAALPSPPPQPVVAEDPPPRWRSGDTLRLRDVIFAFDKAELMAAALPQLDSLAAFLQAHPAIQIDISGHTDSEGDAAYNWRLSLRRAESLRAYLLARGLPPAQVSAGGLGESRPVAGNDTPQGRERNRRVEIVFFEAE
jgi:OmpA-OmpF porin, OOP family